MSLLAGQSFTDSSAGVSFTVGSVSSTGATVHITTSGSASPGPLTTSVTTNQSSYLSGQTVDIIATVLSGTSPAAGVSVTATVKNPTGNSTTLKGMTGNDGTASLSYGLAKHTPAGTYQVGATAPGTAVADASFTVQ
jgi:hypothetical protein